MPGRLARQFPPVRAMSSRAVAVLGSLALLAGIAGCLIPSPARGQACVRFPQADAGPDVTACISAVGTSDFTLSASRSLSAPLNGPIVQHCWTTTFGGFLPSGANTACFFDSDIVLRVPHTPGNTRIQVTLEVTDAAGCSDTDDLLIDLSTPPVLTRAESSVPRICLGETLDLFASAVNTFDSAGLVEYRWDLDITRDSGQNGVADDDADIVLTGVSRQLVVASFVPPRQGHHVARVRAVIAGNACTTFADVPYEVAVAPVVRLVVGPATLCPNEVGDFRAELAFGTSVSDLTWDFDIGTDADGDGDPFNDVEASGQQVIHAYTESGTYTVRVMAMGPNGCQGFEDRTLLVRPAPVPSFTTAGPGCGPLAVNFVDRSTGIDPLTISWDFGDGTGIRTGTPVTHVFPRAGTFTVSHVVTDDQGCMASETRPIVVETSSGIIEGFTLFDGQPGTGSLGNADGFADPGERIRVVVDVRNDGTATASGLVASLVNHQPDSLVTVTDGFAEIPSLAPGESASTLAPHLEAHVSEVIDCGASIPLEVRVTSPGTGGCVEALGFALRIGAPGLQALGEEVALLTTTGRTTPLDSEFGGGAHHVLLLDQSTGASRLRLVRLSGTGQRLGADLLLDDVAGQVLDARIAWANEIGEAAVAWIAVENSAQGPGNLVARFRRVNSGGNAVGVSRRLDLGGFVSTIDLAWAGDHWLVAYADRAPGALQPQLHAQVLTGDALLLGTPVLVGGATEAGSVRVAAVGARSLVAHRTGSELRLYEVEGQRPAVVLGQQVLTDASGHPSLVRHGGGFLVAFQSSSGIDVAWISSSGALSRSQASGGGSMPVLASGPDLAVIAWVSGDDVVARVLGATGRAAGETFLVTPAPERAESPALAAASDGHFVAVFGSRGAAGAVLARAVRLGPALAEDCLTGVLGDIAPLPGGDGRVDISDVVLALRIAVELVEATAILIERGDVAPGERIGNVHRIIGDGVIDISDVVVLLQASTGLIVLTR